jgi:hypothetical protein
MGTTKKIGSAPRNYCAGRLPKAPLYFNGKHCLAAAEAMLAVRFS